MRILKLNNRGISHVIVPLVVVVGLAVAGTYSVVASHAASKTKDQTLSSAKPKHVKTGYLVVYNGGNHDNVKITLVNADKKDYKCGGSFNNDNYLVKHFSNNGYRAVGTTKVFTYKPMKLKCSPIHGDSSYRIAFSINDNYGEGYQAVDVDAGYCTIVHPDASLTRKVQVDAKGSCGTELKAEDAAAKATPVEKIGTSVSVLVDKNIKLKKGLSGYIAVGDPNKAVTKNMCTGQVNVSVNSPVNPSVAIASTNLPLKFYQPVATGPHKEWIQPGKAICVAKMTHIFKSLDAGTYVVTATEAGTNFFKPSGNTATVTIPKAVAKAAKKHKTANKSTGTGGAEAPSEPATVPATQQ